MTDAQAEAVDAQAADRESGVFGVTVSSLQTYMPGIAPDPESAKRFELARELLQRGNALFNEIVAVYIKWKGQLKVEELGVDRHDVTTGYGLQTRRTSTSAVATHRDALKDRGFMQNYAMLVIERNNRRILVPLVEGASPKYGIIDGNHRGAQIKTLVKDAESRWTAATQVDVVMLAGLPVSVYHRLWFEANRFNTRGKDIDEKDTLRMYLTTYIEMLENGTENSWQELQQGVVSATQQEHLGEKPDDDTTALSEGTAKVYYSVLQLFGLGHDAWNADEVVRGLKELQQSLWTITFMDDYALMLAWRRNQPGKTKKKILSAEDYDSLNHAWLPTTRAFRRHCTKKAWEIITKEALEVGPRVHFFLWSLYGHWVNPSSAQKQPGPLQVSKDMGNNGNLRFDQIEGAHAARRFVVSLQECTKIEWWKAQMQTEERDGEDYESLFESLLRDYESLFDLLQVLCYRIPHEEEPDKTPATETATSALTRILESCVRGDDGREWLTTHFKPTQRNGYKPGYQPSADASEVPPWALATWEEFVPDFEVKLSQDEGNSDSSARNIIPDEVREINRKSKDYYRVTWITRGVCGEKRGQPSKHNYHRLQIRTMAELNEEEKAELNEEEKDDGEILEGDGSDGGATSEQEQVSNEEDTLDIDASDHEVKEESDLFIVVMTTINSLRVLNPSTFLKVQGVDQSEHEETSMERV